MRRFICFAVVVSLGAVCRADAQEPRTPAPPAPKQATPPSQTLKLGSVGVSILWRNRVELWDWFEAPPAGNAYGFMNSLVRVGFGQTKKSMSWRLELLQPSYLGAPSDAIGPPPQGALGLGAAYFGANERRTSFGHLFLKQAFAQFSLSPNTTVKAGRFEFFDGTEARIPDAVVNGLVQSRVAHRLLSNEAFPAAQRSVDGATFAWNAGANNVTAFAGRANAGGVHLDGWKELDIEVYYGAYNRTVKAARGSGAFRVFVVGYADHRENVVKPDNRPTPIRSADRESIALATFGANYVHVFDTDKVGKFDVIGWAASQRGSWGTLSHGAASAFGEIGWQPPEPRLKPWLRAGYRYSSGDDNPVDGTNGTFYQVLGATRQYARFPFYNLMNLKDAYGLFAVRPSPRITIRGEVHDLRLADAADLWYGGGGPGQSDAFGYAGRPSHDSDSLATFWDVSADTQLSRHLGLNLYFGHASGGDVIRGTYPSDASGNFGYVETVVRF